MRLRQRDIFYDEYVTPTVRDINAHTGGHLSCIHAELAQTPHAQTGTYVLRMGDWTSVPLDEYAIAHTLSLMTTVAHLAHARGRASLVEARGSD